MCRFFAVLICAKISAVEYRKVWGNELVMTSAAKMISIGMLWFFIACMATLVIAHIIFMPIAAVMAFMVLLLAAGTISTGAITRAH
jgi:hypothetical protein